MEHSLPVYRNIETRESTPSPSPSRDVLFCIILHDSSATPHIFFLSLFVLLLPHGGPPTTILGVFMASCGGVTAGGSTYLYPNHSQRLY